jgi:hypothetical protein
MSLVIATGMSGLFFRVILPLLGYDFYPELTAHMLGLACCAIPSFIGHDRFTFGKRE